MVFNSTLFIHLLLLWRDMQHIECCSFRGPHRASYEDPDPPSLNLHNESSHIQCEGFEQRWQTENPMDLDFASWSILSALIQEHNLHQFDNSVHHFHDFTLFYGGCQGDFSGNLTIVRDSLVPSISSNHRFDRATIVQNQSELGALSIFDIYGPNAASPRGQLWEFLSSLPQQKGLLCGDSNMVEDTSHSATWVPLMQRSEKPNGRPFSCSTPWQISGPYCLQRRDTLFTLRPTR